jgi:hypothetical protein
MCVPTNLKSLSLANFKLPQTETLMDMRTLHFGFKMHKKLSGTIQYI